MGLKLAMTLIPLKPPLPMDTGNQLWGYSPTVQRKGLLRDHTGSFCSSTQATAAQLDRALFPSRETHGVSSTCGDFMTQGEKGGKMRLSQICCKWTIPAKMTHVTLPPLMSPDSISHC